MGESLQSRCWLISLACLGLLGCLGTGGCASVTPPTAEVTNIRATDTSPDGTRFVVTVLLTNPNEEALPLRSVHYSLGVQGLGDYTGSDLPNRTLPSHGVQTVEFPAAIPGNQGEVKGRPVKVTAEIKYQPPGEIRQLMLESGIPLPTVSVEKTGRVE
jgi:LEA14-like dessication related protein